MSDSTEKQIQASVDDLRSVFAEMGANDKMILFLLLATPMFKQHKFPWDLMKNSHIKWSEERKIQYLILEVVKEKIQDVKEGKITL